MSKHRHKKPAEPQPRTALEHLAKQSDTDAADWRYLSRGSVRYKMGYRYWHPKLGLYAKRTITEPETNEHQP